MNFEKWMRARFRLFIGLNILLMVVWSIYLFAVQVLDPHNLEQQRRLRYTPVTEVETALRGFIYDRNENLLVRTSRYYQIDYDKSSLWHYKKNNQQELRKDYDAIATTISKHSNLSKQYVLNRLNRTGSASVYLSDKVRETELINIERELKELGYHRGLVTKFSSQQRNYTQGELGSRLLGSVREIKDQNTGQSVLSKMEGLSGIESAYDKELKGVYGWYQKFLDGHNNPIAIPNLKKQNVKNGNSLVLTIDSRIQEIVEMNLREGLQTYGAKNAIGILIHPKSGEVVAMASISSTDKQHTNAQIRAMANLGVSFMFEPGSTLKPFTSLVA
ncbi:MAG: penicillin-binding transpeptidase domain-containing protein, partial [Candidatus Cloacimonas sp.]|nr:peptidoglycan glycosyltransferase [Candidatus Cloacimonadota bacterium]